MFRKSSNIRLSLALLLLALPLARSSASFSSIYVFGDGVSTTTRNLPPLPRPPSPLYFENTNCNGRVWVEVLAKWQGITYEASKNISYFGHDSQALITSVNSFSMPADSATALYAVWVNSADFVGFMNTAGNEPPYSPSTPLAPWNNFIASVVARHAQAVTTLYDKGARVIVMPNAVNVGVAPYYGLDAVSNAFMKDRVIQFNTAFAAAMISLAASKPELVIHRPDTFTFFEQAIANPSAFGLIHPPGTEGAIFDFESPSLVTGTATNYIFWDDLHPTAKFQMFLADLAQQLISPVKITNITRPGSNAQITIANVPLGRAGAVQGSDTLAPPWLTDAAVNVPFTVGGSTTTSVTFPAAGTKRFYRVGFPVVWTWP
jgi:phospholipase/lecithinase/hemolysin